MYSRKKKRALNRVIVVLFVLCIVIYTFKQILIKISVEIQKAESFMDMQVTSCYGVDDNMNCLPIAETIVPLPDSIFFHETSCRKGLSSKQACSIESAAKLHPHRNIYVFFNAPISEAKLVAGCLSTLLRYKNINLARLHNSQYAKGTALDDMLTNNENAWSLFPVAHTADMLRFVTLYKYGGVYLDTDMLIVKNLDALGKNWAARQDPSTVNTAAMAISQHGVGHDLATNVIEDISISYRSDEWSYNGPQALTRSLVSMCNTSDVLLMSTNACRGFEVYDSKTFYPFYYDKTKFFFTKSTGFWNISADADNKIYGYHLWNQITGSVKVEMESPFEKLARKYCPLIRERFGDNFGTDIEHWSVDLETLNPYISDQQNSEILQK